MHYAIFSLDIFYSSSREFVFVFVQEAKWTKMRANTNGKNTPLYRVGSLFRDVTVNIFLRDETVNHKISDGEEKKKGEGKKL